jgi:predicted phosphoribosyltransferase
MARFADRRAAGRVLADALAEYAGRSDVVVLGLPRGGVPVGYEVASRLGVELDIFVVRKLGMPGHEEYAIGAIASGGVRVDNPEIARHVPRSLIAQVEQRERMELLRRERAYRGDRPPLDVRGKTVIVVDDGLATGSTMRAAVLGLRSLGPASIVVAVPVAVKSTCAELRSIADHVVCATTPEPLHAVGLWYDDFSQTSDAEVHELLASLPG